MILHGNINKNRKAGLMALFYKVQINEPKLGKNSPRIVRFYVRKEDYLRESDMRDWTIAMQAKLIAYLNANHSAFVGKASCKIIACVSLRGKKTPTSVEDPGEISIEELLKLNTFQEAS